MNNDKGTVLARVHDAYLYEIDIEGLVPPNSSPRDSITLVNNFTDNWVRTQLMVQQAKKNLTIQQLDFDKQLEDYRNSLIIFHYETELIRQNLDTITSDEEIEAYYLSHLGDFVLKSNIAKVLYVILDKETEVEENFVDFFSLPDSVKLDSLELYGRQYARSFFLDTASWFRFDELTELIPIETYNQELFLKGHRFVRLSDEYYVYLVNFVDFKIKDDTSPLDFKRKDIRNIILNQRKMQLIKRVRQDIYENAVQYKDFEVYYNE